MHVCSGNGETNRCLVCVACLQSGDGWGEGGQCGGWLNDILHRGCNSLVVVDNASSSGKMYLS